MTEINKRNIEDRVKDWKERLNTLYVFVEQSLSNNKEVELRKDRLTTMHEELMQKYSVSPEKIPLLDIYKNKNIIATFKPIGLWVIGANVRVDILTESGAYIVVDISEKGEESNWQVYSPKNRKEGRRFDSSFIAELVDQA